VARHANVVVASLVIAAVLAAGSACGGAGAARSFPPPPAGADDGAAREVLGRFVRALDAGRFDEAHALLSSRWRVAYTPGRLALDFRGSGPAAREAAARVAAGIAAGEPIERSAQGARLPVVGGRAALLVLEAGGWRVDALE
jgi:hypothetical protein